MEAVFNLDNQVGSVEGNNIAGEKLLNRESISCAPRKKLADISNVAQQTKQAKQAVKSSTILLQKNEQIERLQKENIVLTKALADRNRIIDVGAIELQKLRNDLQKVQEKNLQLAQANNQMLAELNSGKDKIKLLQHELDCKNCLLKEKAKSGTCHFNASEARDETVKPNDAGEFSQAGKPCNTCRRQQQRNQSLNSNSAELVQAEEKVSKKRPCKRRQSARFRSEEAGLCAVSLEMGDSKGSISNECAEPLKENCPAPSTSSMEKEHEEKNAANVENQAHPRSSLGRPLRRAAEKVQSYKEIPLNVKMRREVPGRRIRTCDSSSLPVPVAVVPMASAAIGEENCYQMHADIISDCRTVKGSTTEKYSKLCLLYYCFRTHGNHATGKRKIVPSRWSNLPVKYYQIL
ncbi:SHUGOSHIN 2-like isoform X2 [Punica granatum]|uniref:SHUGOSHIN 2-like isoform X2 n=1 Tax=Punica granatum TaxID=22663 RepID=A0A6P8CBN6_PUNGR|nr:SHUGOSHIN 2-like isoform X2 [Punica granatum]